MEAGGANRIKEVCCICLFFQIERLFFFLIACFHANGNNTFERVKLRRVWKRRGRIPVAKC